MILPLASRKEHTLCSVSPHIFLLLVMATTAMVGSTCSTFKNQTSNTTPVDAPLDLCDLLRKPDDFDSKTVRVRSVLIGYHELALYSASCDSQMKYIRADLDSKSRNELVQGVTILGERGMQRGNFWVDVVVVGQFETIPESDCKNVVKESGPSNHHSVNYCYRIQVSKVERVEIVSATVAWPQ